MNDPVRLLLDAASALVGIYGVVGFAHPLRRLPGGIGLPEWAAPTLALASLLSLIVLSGIAIASLAILITSLFVAALILDAVFGVAFEVGS